MRDQKTRTLVECGLLIALAIVLSMITVYELPQGGSITAASMMPLAIISFRHGPKWGLLSGVVYGLLQIVPLGGIKNVLYCKTLFAMVLCVLLDYLLAYGMMGLACIFGAPVGAGLLGSSVISRDIVVAVGTVVSGLLRYLCSFLSGVILWGEYAPEGMSVWFYSLTYNGSYMIPEIILTTIAAVLVMRVLDRQKQ